MFITKGINAEKDILKVEVRREIIRNILSPDNIARKQEAYKRYMIYKDKTKDFVIEKISKELGAETAKEVIHRTPNLSIARKIVNKKAMVYKDGIKRTTKKGDQPKLDELIDLLNHNVTMKKTNRFVEIFKTIAVQTLPYKDKSSGEYEVINRVLPSYLYDVVVDIQNKERPIAYITSDMPEQKETYYTGIGEERIHSKTATLNKVLQETPATEFVWWSKNYHFTTDEKGEYIKGDTKGDGLNMIKEIPYTTFTADQDGEYWAMGGDDIVDVSVLINLLLADLFYIAKYQGMGLLYITGKGVNETIKIGPSEAVIIEQREGEPTPQVGFATSSPPIADHLSMIKETLVYLLDSNGLQYGGGSVDNAAGAQSGIQEIIQRSDNMENIEDQQELYRDLDPAILRKSLLWANYLGSKKLLNPKWVSMSSLNPDIEIAVNFPAPQPFISDMEKLEIIEKRTQLGLDTMLDLIKKDNPDMTDKEAKQKLKEILLEKAEKQRERMKEFGGKVNGGSEQDNEDDRSNTTGQQTEQDKDIDDSGKENS